MGRDRPAPWGGPALQPALTVWVGMAPLSPGAPREHGSAAGKATVCLAGRAGS